MGGSSRGSAKDNVQHQHIALVCCGRAATYKHLQVAAPSGQKMTECSGAVVLELNGCKWCDEFVFLPSNPARQCPKCHRPRYDHAGKPFEVCLYFPLETQLRQLLDVPAFRELLQHEFKPPCNRRYMTDVYDSPMWQQVVGPPARGQLRIVLQLAVDGIPAFNNLATGLSLKPWGHMILSLPPRLRVKACNFVLQCLIPSTLKGKAAKKYYDFAADFEINRLHTTGIDGVRVIVFGTTLDTPGRRELLALQVFLSKTAYFCLKLSKAV